MISDENHQPSRDNYSYILVPARQLSTQRSQNTPGTTFLGATTYLLSGTGTGSDPAPDRPARAACSPRCPLRNLEHWG